ncbi:MAG: ABC-type oligopeptide transport system substrate-binding subunit [Vicingaceae bacterium]|jgi:ABC-type oligopeptide transport system substrate-binding subunit
MRIKQIVILLFISATLMACATNGVASYKKKKKRPKNKKKCDCPTFSHVVEPSLTKNGEKHYFFS